MRPWQCNLIVKSPEILESRLGKIRVRDDCPVLAVNFRGATGSRSSGWGERQPGGIPLSPQHVQSYNSHSATLALSVGLFPTYSLVKSWPQCLQSMGILRLFIWEPEIHREVTTVVVLYPCLVLVIWTTSLQTSLAWTSELCISNPGFYWRFSRI